MSESRFEQVTLSAPGGIPGIPGGTHAPGTYIVDWQERIAVPAVIVPTSEPSISIEQAIAQAQQVLAPVSPSTTIPAPESPPDSPLQGDAQPLATE